MTDYYDLPPPKQKHSYRWAVLILLLLLLLGIVATWWSLRIKPGELGEDPMLATASAPLLPLAATQPAANPPLPEPAPIEDIPEPALADDMVEPEVVAPIVEPEAEPPPPLFSDASWRETARFTGTDAAGRDATFTAYVLVGDETWTFAKADSIFTAGLSQPVETAFDKLNLGAGICELTRVIAIGAASVEGTSERNTYLSFARGHALKSAISANLPCEVGMLPTSVLDLGYNRQEVACPDGEKTCPEQSAPQRPVAMILADAEDSETDIGEALRAGIAAHEASGEHVLPDVDISDYSAFNLR